MTKILLLAAIACAALLAPHVGSASLDGRSGTDSSIVIGVSNVQSGPSGSLRICSAGSSAYFDLVNQQGGVFGRITLFYLKMTSMNRTLPFKTQTI